MDPLQTLTELFRSFPGIGPKQAGRFVYFLLHKEEFYRQNIAKQITALGKAVTVCEKCQRFFATNDMYEKKTLLCNVCANLRRDATRLMLVARDNDFTIIEKSGAYNGFYFILGGLIPILEKNPEKIIRQSLLVNLVQTKITEGSLKEIIIALPATSEGENTERYIKSLLSPLVETKGISLSVLGRGLSTGLELEYSDSDTIKNALKNRQ